MKMENFSLMRAKETKEISFLIFPFVVLRFTMKEKHGRKISIVLMFIFFIVHMSKLCFYLTAHLCKSKLTCRPNG